MKRKKNYASILVYGIDIEMFQNSENLFKNGIHFKKLNEVTDVTANLHSACGECETSFFHFVFLPCFACSSWFTASAV
jgi:hypothetical protein